MGDLIERLKAATGPNTLLDAEIYATVGGAPHTTICGDRTIPLIENGDPDKYPAYTASVDAALALVERKLPGWRMEQIAWGAPKHGDTLIVASMGNLQDGDKYRSGDGVAPTVPLAILIAPLSVLPEQH